jgi:hypothetical protein
MWLIIAFNWRTNLKLSLGWRSFQNQWLDFSFILIDSKHFELVNLFFFLPEGKYQFWVWG